MGLLATAKENGVLCGDRQLYTVVDPVRSGRLTKRNRLEGPVVNDTKW